MLLSVLSTYLLFMPLAVLMYAITHNLIINDGLVGALILGFSVVVLVFAPLLNWGLSRVISKPIAKLNEELLQIEDYTDAQTLRVSSKDEIGELRNQYNRILTQVRILTHDLEARVNERTEELKKKQQELIRIEKLASIGELAAGVAHEINNPLAILAANGDELKFRVQKGQLDDLEKYFNVHSLTIDRISSITGNLSYFARDEGDEVRPQEVHRFIRESVELLDGIYRKLDIEIITDLRATGSIINANIGKLQQVLFNLLSNARDALVGVDQAQIKISTQTSHDRLFIELEDNGCGMSDEVLEKMFDSFFTTKPAGKGTGLGMPLVAQFVNEFDGNINIQSEVGKGTKIILDFPLTSEEDFVQDTSEIKVDLEDLRLAGSILFAEDEPILRTYFKSYLESFGLSVDTAKNGVEALEMLQIKQYDLLLTDIQMPLMNGDELIHQLTKEQIAIPIVVLTGGVNPSEQVKSAFDKTEIVLSKPADKEYLIQEVTKVLKNAKSVSPTKKKTSVQPSILLVDDELELLELNTSQLSLFDYETFSASATEDALKLAAEKQPHYVLLDVNMPGSKVSETIRQINTLSPQSKIMVISGEDSATVKSRLDGLEVFQIFMKPFGMTAVHEKIQKDQSFEEAA